MNIEKINRALQRRTLYEIREELAREVEYISRLYIYSVDPRGQLSCSTKNIHPVMGGAPEDFEENFTRLHRKRMLICEDLHTSRYVTIGSLHVECYDDQDSEEIRLLASLCMSQDLSPFDLRIYTVDYTPSVVLFNGELVASSVALRRVS